ncbi:MAG: DUF1616 domain-containing protein [Actinomycetota bacterium]|nr:DUF1616 domain-containing protein [Actinomycetota bacterium]
MAFLDGLRSIAALLFLIFIPGFAWTLVFFKEREVDILERFVYSIALSIALMAIALFFANRLLGVRINVPNSFAIVVVLTAIPFIHRFLSKRGHYDRLRLRRSRNGLKT